MNEKIKELAEQAGFDIEDGHIMLHHLYFTNRMEKFVQLIVKDCELLAQQRYNTATMGPPVRSFLNDIKQNFGIEE